MRIALFKNLLYDNVSPWSSVPMAEGYVQVSDWVEVEFPPLNAEQQAYANEITALARRQKVIEDDYRARRKEIDKRRQEALANINQKAVGD